MTYYFFNAIIALYEGICCRDILKGGFFVEERYTTANGVDIYSYKNPSSHGFFISLFLRAGSMYEDEKNNGITHFLEHISIRNINKEMGGALYSELDRRAIEFNASTFSEMVQFYICGAKKNFAFSADVLCRLFSKITLDKSEIESERKRIKAEIRESDDKSSLLSFTNSVVHRGTSLSRSIAGTLGSVDKITAKRLEEYRKSAFSRGNFFFYVTGNFDASDILYLAQCVEKYSFSSGEVRENFAPVAEDFAARYGKVEIKNSDFCAVRFTFDLDMKALSVPETDLVYDILLSGYNSRFFIEMSEKRGLFYDISGAVERYRNVGELYFTYEIRERDIEDALAITVDILRSLKDAELSAEDCMKTSYTDNAYMLLDDARELNFTMAYDNHIMHLGYPNIEERIAAYKNVSPERIRAVACEIFRPKNLTLTVKGDKKRINKSAIERIISSL